MLVLSRRVGEEIVIDEHIRVAVAAIHGNRVRLSIWAPPSVRVDRQEVHEQRALEASADASDPLDFVWGARGRLTAKAGLPNAGER